MKRQENESADVQSVKDDAALLAELDQLELRGISRPRPAVTIARDANRWNLHPLPGSDPQPRVPQARAGRHLSDSRRAWLPIVAGLCGGAAASAALFHDRLAAIWRSFGW